MATRPRVLSREVWYGFIIFLDLAAYSSHTNRRRGIQSTCSFGLMSILCHYRDIGRARAEELLHGANRDGSYLIRNSESVAGAYILCVLYHGNLSQYRILPDGEGRLYVKGVPSVEERKFVDLIQLVHEYVQRGSNNGLVCALSHPINRDAESETANIATAAAATAPVPIPNGCLDERLQKSDNENKLERLLSGPVPAPSPASSYENCRDEDDFLDEEEEMDGEEEEGEEEEQEEDLANTVPSAEVEEWKSHETISRLLLQRFSKIDLSSEDGGFIGDLKNYTETGVRQDMSSLSAGGRELHQLRQVLEAAGRGLEKQLEIFLGKIDICSQLLGEPLGTPLYTDSYKEEKERSPGLSGLLDRLVECRNVVHKFEEKTIAFLQELRSSSERGQLHVLPESEPVPMLAEQPKPTPQRSKVVIPPTSFKVHQLKVGKPKSGSKFVLTVDLQGGKLMVVKQSKDVLDDSNTFIHDKIEQLVKWTNNSNRLDILIEGRKKETYVFDDVWQREHFCQLVQKLRSRHSHNVYIDQISIFIGTWNMGADPPPASISQWLKSHGTGITRSSSLGLIPHDLYVIGTQESALSDKEWVNRIKAALQETFAQEMHLVSIASLWSLRLVILVRADYKNKISHIQSDSVKTGIANALGNKGAVGIGFHFNGTSMCFINAHLTSGHEKNARRNENVHDIINHINLWPKHFDMFDVGTKFHHVFFFGDLNYRIHGLEPTEIIKMVAQQKLCQKSDRNYTTLLEYDQLTCSKKNKEAFFGFCEEDITFPPTYRIEKNTIDKYDWRKIKKTGIRINAPSWCDRILWRSFPDTYIKCTSYGCVENITTSDHKPVFSSFEVGITGQFITPSASHAHNENVKIIFDEIIAEVWTSTCRYSVQVELISSCLAQNGITQKSIHMARQATECYHWKAYQIPVLQPLFGDHEYLEDQYILLVVKHSDSMEIYGEGILSLKYMFSTKPESFDCYLTHEGDEVGRIKGMMFVKGCGEDGEKSKLVRRRKSYELVYMDTKLLDGSNHSTLTRLPELQEGETAGGGQNAAALVAGSDFSINHSISVDSLLRPNRTSISREPRRRRSQPPEISDADHKTPCRSISQPDGGVNGAGTPVEWRNSPIFRKPRMGQSSLNSNSVLPVSKERYGNRNSPPNTSQHDENFNPQPVPRNRDSKLFHFPEDNACYMNVLCEKEMTNLDIQGNVTRDVTPPPPPPPKQKNQNMQYDCYEYLQPPATINEWLLNLGLPQYINIFFEHGWDQLTFISDLTEKDLFLMNVNDPEHRRRVLDSIRDMKS